MRFEKYETRHYPVLAVAARALKVAPLLRRDFVDYYYQGQPWSELNLALDEDGSCAAFIGFDRLRFELDGQELSIGMATNFYTLKPGMGGFLWLQWMKSCGVGMVFGGSRDTHSILKKQPFTYYPGINAYAMNAQYSIYSDDPAWKRALKYGLQKFVRKSLKDYRTRRFREETSSINVEEISPANFQRMESKCFPFRFAPTEEYLRWRYNTSLQFVRYRWFEIRENGARVGYCILNDAPKQAIVAHCDGNDPKKLAHGILKAIFLTSQSDERQRSALLVSSHPQMQEIFMRHGFLLDTPDRTMAIGSLRSKLNLPEPQSWLINFGLGDNDLRPSTFL